MPFALSDRTVRFAAIVACGVSLAGAVVAAAQGRGASTPGVVAAVRTAIGHGDLDEARRYVGAAPAGPAREFAAALVDLFEGRDAEARARLLPLAAAAPLGEAALELALLDRRQGRRDEAWRVLDRMAEVRNFAGPDDYFRLARAARGIGEFLLANDAYQRVIDVARADIQTEWGDMLLERHRAGEAMASYEQALKADPRWIRAHLGRARALALESAAKAAAALEPVRKLAPDHPDLWLFVAEERLEQEDPDGAASALDRVARVRQGTVEEAALRAAVAVARRDPAAETAALARVDTANPQSALGLRRAGQQAARSYRFDEAAAYARRAVARDPDDADAHAELGLYLLRTGDERTARAELETAFRLDRSNPVTANLLRMLDSLDTFEVVTDGPIVYKFAREEAAVLAPYATAIGREAYRTFRARYGFTPPDPILVEVFPQHDDFAVRTFGLPGLVGALGACFGRVVVMDSPRARRPGEFSWQATLWHELAHAFTLQASDYRLPRWLSEGLSTFEEHRRQPAWGRELTLEFASQLAAGRTFGLRGLPDAFKRPESLPLAYFEASLVVEHLVDLRGDEGVQRLLRAYAEGAGDGDAFARAFGQSPAEVDASFGRFVAGRYGALRDALRDVPEADPADLPALAARAAAHPWSFLAQWTLGQAHLKAGDVRGAREALERAAALAPPATGASSPGALLARLALDRGDAAAARRELRALLTHDHANVALARQLAALAGEDAADDRDFALRLIADLDPFDADAHDELGRREMARGRHQAALIEFQAALALGPANPAEAYANVAEAFLALGRREDAKRMALRALQEAPTFARAQDLLLAAIGRD